MYVCMKKNSSLSVWLDAILSQTSLIITVKYNQFSP